MGAKRGMKVAYTISGLGHAAILLWSIWTLAAKPLPAPPAEALPIDLVDVSDVPQIMKGVREAPKAEKPKPLAEKVAEAKSVDDTTAKVEKKEVKAAREPPPAAEAKPVEPEPAKAEPKPDPIAEALAKESAKKPETKKAETKKPTPPKKPAPPTPTQKYDPSKIAELLDKRDAKRVASAAPMPEEAPSLGLANGASAQLSQYEFAEFKRKLGDCWGRILPPGVDRTTDLSVLIRVQFKRDGFVLSQPQVVSGPVSPLGPALAESAKRALLSCQPYNMLRPERYEHWQDLELEFNPKQMLQG